MKRLTSLIVAMSAALSAGALTLDEARSLAAERYPLVRDYNLIELTNRYTIENAAKAWLPQVNLGAQATWQTDVASYPEALQQMLATQGVDIRGIDKLQWKAQVEVSQVIWDGGRIKASKDVSQAEAEEARYANDTELYQLRSRVDDIYFGILLLELQKEAVESSLTLLEANLDKINAVVKNGAAMQSDAYAIEAELLTSRQQLTSIQSSIDSYRDILELFIGNQANEPLQIPEMILPPATDNAVWRPEMGLMSAREATLDARRKAVEASVMPRVGAFAQGFYGYPGLNFMDAMMNRTPSLNAIVGISLSWNIGELYTRSNRLKSLQTSAQRIEVARDVFQFNVGVQALGKRNELRRLQLLSESDNEIVELRAKVRKASEARLREGIVEPTDLLLRITEEKNAVIAANTHKIEYLKALYNLQNILPQQ